MSRKSLMSDLPVVRSAAARTLFLLSAVVTVAILLWTHHLRMSGFLAGHTPIYYVLFAYDDYQGATETLLVLIAATLIPLTSAGRSLLRWVGGHPATVAAASAVAMMLGTLYIYHDHPLSMDEYAAYFQSRVFAAGHLAGRFPVPQLDWLIPPGFQNGFLNVSQATGSVASSYWPSYSLILAPFTLLGIPWACNPLLSALALLVIHRLAMELFADVEAAGMAVLLTAASPVFFAYGISYYSWQAHLLMNAGYALLLVRPTPRRALLAGLVGSVALTLHNPVPHILFCIPWLVYLATRPDRWILLACAAVGYAPLCLVLGVGWYVFSSHLIHAGGAATVVRQTSNQQSLALIFHLPNFRSLSTRLMDLAKLWVWSSPGLLVLAAAGTWRWRHHTLYSLLLASALVTLVGYLFFPFDQGHGWGARYFHSAWAVLPLLATAAVFRPATRSPAPGSPVAAPSRFEDPAARSFFTTCALLSLIVGVGFRAWQIQDFVGEALSHLPQYRGSERHIVFVDWHIYYYSGDLIQNDPWLRDNAVRMMSFGNDDDAKMMANYYPGWRKVYADQHGTVWSAAPTAASSGSRRPAVE